MNPKPVSVIDLTDEKTPKKQTQLHQNEEIEVINSNTSDFTSSQDIAIVRTLKTNGIDTELISSSSPVALVKRAPKRRSGEEISVVKSVKIEKPRKRVIPAPPKVPVEEPPISDASKKCPVCFDALRKPSVTLCGHVFCTQCILAVVRSTKQCPICRKKLSARGFHPLYL